MDQSKIDSLKQFPFGFVCGSVYAGLKSQKVDKESLDIIKQLFDACVQLPEMARDIERLQSLLKDIRFTETHEGAKYHDPGLPQHIKERVWNLVECPCDPQAAYSCKRDDVDQPEEKDVFKFLQMDYIEPSDRYKEHHLNYRWIPDKKAVV